MANHKSALKRDRQSKKLQTLNRFWKSRVRTAAKTVLEAVEKKDKKAAQTSLQLAMKEIDKAAGKKVIPSSTASRKISRLSKAVAGIA
ncbi:MAG: 30S ribosomal protein S20 [Proteobacteria bacterium]|jgi:small subunit ribosomal protein S20|nr:30S ribosomal protein S20 [Pseudomonadota bacterium]